MTRTPRVIALVTSEGGLEALITILSDLPDIVVPLDEVAPLLCKLVDAP